MIPAATPTIWNCELAVMMKVTAPGRAASISQITSALAPSTMPQRKPRTIARRSFLDGWRAIHHALATGKKYDRDRDGGDVRTEPEPQEQQRQQRNQRRGGERDEERTEKPSEHARDAGEKPNRMPTATAGNRPQQQDRRAGIDMFAVVSDVASSIARFDRSESRQLIGVLNEDGGRDPCHGDDRKAENSLQDYVECAHREFSPPGGRDC